MRAIGNSALGSERLHSLRLHRLWRAIGIPLPEGEGADQQESKDDQSYEPTTKPRHEFLLCQAATGWAA